MDTSFLKFGLYNFLIGVLAGLILNLDIEAVLLPGFSVFICGLIFWSILANNPLSKPRVVTIGVLTGLASHFLFWFSMSVMEDVSKKYGGEEKDVLLIFIFGSVTSLFYIGWLSAGISVGIGFLMRSKILP